MPIGIVTTQLETFIVSVRASACMVEWSFKHYFLAVYEGLETYDYRLPLCVLRASNSPSKTGGTSI